MSSRGESNVENEGFANTDYSSGDNNTMNTKLKQRYQEENNNEINELSRDLEMGCIVDAVKRPPNICVETCVYEGPESEDSEVEEFVEEDAYSDEFEEDKSDGEEEIKMEPKLAKSETMSRKEEKEGSSVKLEKSHSFTSSKVTTTMKSGRSSQYGSFSVPETRRINMSFTNDRLREIERHNHILLNKILTARNQRKSSIPAVEPEAPKLPLPSAAIHRKKKQRQIDRDNMVLLRKIQRAKSSACSIRR